MTEFATLVNCLFTLITLNSLSKGFQWSGYQRDAASHKFPGNGTEALSYSQWSMWSSCSASCSLGITTRSRTCQKRLSNSGMNRNYCLGESVEHKICKLAPCPSGSQSSRAFQCSRYNNRHVAGQQAKSWVPINDGSNNPCELKCQSDGMVSSFGKVADGTQCSNGICLDGRCLPIGCDERIDSRAEIDMCGVCGGRNTTCVHYKDIFRGQPQATNDQDRRSSYEEVAVIPTGSRNLEIRQHIGENILAIRDRSNSVLYHGKERQGSNENTISGTRITYSQEDQNRTEVLATSGPTSEPLYILVLLRGRNPGIHYQYWSPLESSRAMFHQPNRHHIGTDVPAHTSTHPPIQYRFNTGYFATAPAITARPSPTYYRKPVAHVYDTNGQTTRMSVQYGPKRKGFAYPLFENIDDSSPAVTESYRTLPPLDNVLRYNYRTPKPVYNYYEKFRNVTFKPSISIYRKTDLVPQETQRDSGIPDTGKEIKKNRYDPHKLKNEPISKYDNISHLQDIDPNLRWKYNINGFKNDSYAQHSFTTPISIEFLPLPETKPIKTRRGRLRGSKYSPNSRISRGESCPPCERMRDLTKHFCTSEFIVRVVVLGLDFINGETRYELEILQTFKNTFSLLPKEYVWSPDTCRCPKLRVGKEYVLMGRSDSNYRKNESRLIVDRGSFVRIYNLKYGKRLLKLRKNHARKCSSKIS